MFFSRRENIGVLSILLLFLASASTVLAIDPRCPVDPYADPANDPCNPLKYIPSNALTVLALRKIALAISFVSSVLNVTLSTLFDSRLHTDVHDMGNRWKIHDCTRCC